MRMSTAYTREESFREVEKLVHSTVWQFKRLYGGELEELTGLAFLAYSKAYEDFDLQISSFSNHVRYRVWMALEDRRRSQAKRLTREQVLPIGSKCFDTARREGFSPDLFFGDLSPDAQFLGMLVLETPGGLLRRLTPTGPGVSYGSVFRKGLKAFLQDLGWSLERITETFQEIREALA